MKRSLLYGLLLLVIGAIAIMLFTGNKKKKNRQIDQRISLRRTDKIPYGGYVAYQSLQHLFPNTAISAAKSTPGYWDSISRDHNDDALIIVSPRFYADEFEMKGLLRFMQNGNSVFISTLEMSAAAMDLLGRSSVYNDRGELTGTSTVTNDSMTIRLIGPPFNDTLPFHFRGARFKGWFDKVDTNYADVIGTDNKERPNFIHIKAGKGNLYVHLFPLAFSNYFLLQKDNLAYYENALSVIPSETKRIVWDEYFIDKTLSSSSDDFMTPPSPSSSGRNRGLMGELFSYSEFRAAFWIALLAVVLFVALEMRRRQRLIPAYPRPRNDSLDFVKTIGRLYYDKGDHKNLCHKMAAYFLEHVRNKYKLQTSVLDEDFVNKLRFKTGVDEFLLREIVFFIRDIDNMPDTAKVTDNELVNFHKKLETFYKKA
ncbi:MAG TPA: DUF4350 domain-containing protein [Chitinophagaceae bacterium]|jgi:hypothetical protein|nr:DUF4350 domain-containing protein [Chitinophagaceae bacterium]